MSEGTNYTAQVEVPAPGEHGGEASPGLLQVSGPLMILTWAVFLVMTWILYKVAWKPILKALDMREDSIRQAVKGAENTKAEMGRLEARGKEMLAEAERESRAIVDEARVSAHDIVKAAEAKAGEDSAARIEQARREILAATEQARAVLRKECAELTIQMTSRLIGENMDAARNRTLVDRWVKEL